MAGIHRILGYVVVLGVVVAALHARGLVRSGREFVAEPYVIATIALDVQVLLGILAYVSDRVWEASDVPMLAYAHPAVMVAALGLGHVMIRRARNEQMAADGYRVAGNGLVGVAVLTMVGVALAVLA